MTNGGQFVLKEVDISARARKRANADTDVEVDQETERAMNEVLLLRKLSHPAIVRYYDSYVVRKRPRFDQRNDNRTPRGSCFLESESSYDSSPGKSHYILAIIMEYADGGDLAQELNRRLKSVKHTIYDEFALRNNLKTVIDEKRSRRARARVESGKDGYLTEDEVMLIFVQCLMALHYLHSKRIVHRDVKTRNIFLTLNGCTKLGDLGISKELLPNVSLAHSLVGSPFFMSPELHSNIAYNNKCDVWALGCVLFEICCLRHAFSGRTMTDVRTKVLANSPGRLPARYSKDMQSLLNSMLQTDPALRPSTSDLMKRPFIVASVKRLCQLHPIAWCPQFAHLHYLNSAYDRGVSCESLKCERDGKCERSLTRIRHGAFRRPQQFDVV